MGLLLVHGRHHGVGAEPLVQRQLAEHGDDRPVWFKTIGQVEHGIGRGQASLHQIVVPVIHDEHCADIGNNLAGLGHKRHARSLFQLLRDDQDSRPGA